MGKLTGVAIDSKIQRFNAKAAQRIGQHYDVYRLSPQSTGSILAQANRIMSNFPIRMVLNMEGFSVEQTKIYGMIFEGLCNANFLNEGDIFVELDGDGSMYALATNRPMNPNVFARVESSGSITRPWGELPTGQTNFPVHGRIGFQGAGKANEMLCVLNNGYYSFVNVVANPATIPMAVQPYKRLGQMPDFKIPTGTHRNEVFAYCPLLPGIQIQPGDVLSPANGDRYMVHTVVPFTEGLQGYQMICESLFI